MEHLGTITPYSASVLPPAWSEEEAISKAVGTGIGGLWCTSERAARKRRSTRSKRNNSRNRFIFAQAHSQIHWWFFSSHVLLNNRHVSIGAIQPACSEWKQMKLTTEEEFLQGQSFGCTSEQKLLLNCRQPSRHVSHRSRKCTCCRMVQGPPLTQSSC